MNTLRNIARKAIAVGSGAAVFGATLAGAAADLGDYPAPFIRNGQFDGLLVVGENAATSDVIGSIDIATSLQTASTVPVGGGGGSTTVLTGDAFQIGDSGDILEIGEQIGAVTETISDGDLEMLQSGTVTTQQGTTDFTQTLNLVGSSEVVAADTTSGSVLLDENNDDETGMYLFFNDGDPVFEYELEFTSGLESDVDADDNAEDLEDESIMILGQWFSIVDTDVDDAASDFTLELIAGDRSDTLSQGETRTYTIDGETYEVTVLVIGDASGDTTAKFLVNGEVTDALTDGDTDTLSDGLEIGVRDIIETSAYFEGAQQSIVEFYLGANKIEITDSNFGVEDGAADIEVNGESVEDLNGDINAVNVSGGVRINSLIFNLTADAAYQTDIFLADGEGLRDAMDEPEGMLASGWDITFEGVSMPSTTPIEFNANGEDEYSLEFTNRRGETFSVPYVYASAATTGTFGDEDDALVFFERDTDGDNAANIPGDFNIAIDDYFIVTDIGAVATADDEDDTYVLQLTDVNEDDSTVSFTHVGTGSEIEETFTGTASTANATPATGELTIGGKDFSFWFYEPSAGVYAMAVDLDNSGSLTNNTVVEIVTRGGAILDPFVNATGAAASVGAWNASVTILDDNVDSDVSQVTNLVFTPASSELDVDIPSTDSTAGVWFYSDYDDEDKEAGIDGYGTWFEKTDDADDADSLTISVPSEQVEANVYVTGAEVRSSTVSNGGSVQINPIAVGSAVLDSDVSYDQDNMIVVGGPCVNTIAARLLGNPADCAEGFVEGRATLRLFDTGANTALLVAGYSAQDTVAASRVVAEYADYDLMGDEMVVVRGSGNTVDVMEP